MPLDLDYIDFWEMGQADCSVLHLSDGSIIIIDVGKIGSPLIDWLANRARTIRAVILTHNDADHAGALCPLVQEHSSRIGAIYLLQDRPKEDPKFKKLFRCALEGEKLGHYRMSWLEAGKTIWASENGLTKLIVVHPSFAEYVGATSPNSVCAMLALEHENRILAVWSGDLSIKHVADKFALQGPWMMTGPHHGAPSDYKKKPEAKEMIDSLSPKRSYLSVGTQNPYFHPRPRYVLLLAATGCQVSCSQLTRWCDTGSLGGTKPIFPGTAMLGLPAPRGNGIACRGAWRTHFKNGRLVSDSHDAEHLSRVAKLRRPLCLRGRGWRQGDPPLPAVI